MKLFSRIDNPDPKWLLSRYKQEHYLPTEVVVAEPKIVVPVVGRSYDIDLFCRWDRGDGKLVIPAPEDRIWHYAVLIPYDKLRTLPDFSGTSHEIQVRLYEIWGEFGSDGHTDYQLVCWMLHPGECKIPFHKMYDEYYDLFRS